MSVHVMTVSIYGQEAGVIERDGGRITMSYDRDYVTGRNATPLSLSMPLTSPSHPKRVVEAFLKGLLPDNAEVRQRWARTHRLKDGDTFGLIAAIGADVAGAATFAPDPGGFRGLWDNMVPQSERDIADRLRSLRLDDADWLAPGDEEHWSLAGAQGKFALAKTPAGWSLPQGDQASTHIFKPGIVGVPGSAVIEHLTMQAFAAVGLSVAATELMSFEDQQAVVVERFDRRAMPGGRVARIHQEDLVQALALDPARKYQSQRGPDVATVAALLRGSADPQSLDRFIDAVIANFLVGAPDAHAKNYSVTLAGSNVRLAPLYDVASGLVKDQSGRLRWRRAAMSVGGESRFGEATAKNWRKFATAVGRPEEMVLSRVEALAEALPDAFADATAQLPSGVQAAEFQPIAGRIAKLAERTVQQMAVTDPARSKSTFYDELEGL